MAALCFFHSARFSCPPRLLTIFKKCSRYLLHNVYVGCHAHPACSQFQMSAHSICFTSCMLVVMPTLLVHNIKKVLMVFASRRVCWLSCSPCLLTISNECSWHLLHVVYVGCPARPACSQSQTSAHGICFTSCMLVVQPTHPACLQY